MESRSPIPRWLALVAVFALVASGGLCAYSILTDRADFRGGAGAEPSAAP